MKAAVVHGLAHTPRYDEFPDAVAAEHENLVTVTAAATKAAKKQFGPRG